MFNTCHAPGLIRATVKALRDASSPAVIIAWEPRAGSQSPTARVADRLAVVFFQKLMEEISREISRCTGEGKIGWRGAFKSAKAAFGEHRRICRLVNDCTPQLFPKQDDE